MYQRKEFVRISAQSDCRGLLSGRVNKCSCGVSRLRDNMLDDNTDDDDDDDNDYMVIEKNIKQSGSMTSACTRNV